MSRTLAELVAARAALDDEIRDYRPPNPDAPPKQPAPATMTRAKFDALPAADRFAHFKAGGEVVD